MTQRTERPCTGTFGTKHGSKSDKLEEYLCLLALSCSASGVILKYGDLFVHTPLSELPILTILGLLRAHTHTGIIIRVSKEHEAHHIHIDGQLKKATQSYIFADRRINPFMHK